MLLMFSYQSDLTYYESFPDPFSCRSNVNEKQAATLLTSALNLFKASLTACGRSS